MQPEKLPVYVNRYPDGRGTLTCAHCAIDADLEGATSTALYAARTDEGFQALVWDSTLTAEQLLGAAAAPCMHLAPYHPAAPLVRES